MESKGYTRQTVLVTLTNDVVQTINNKHSTTISDDILDVSIKKLLSSEHLSQRCMSGCKNSNLQITSKGGVAVVTSIRAKEEHLQNRTFLKKVSDFTDKHKGIITLVAISLALVSFVLRLKGII